MIRKPLFDLIRRLLGRLGTTLSAHHAPGSRVRLLLHRLLPPPQGRRGEGV